MLRKAFPLLFLLGFFAIAPTTIFSAAIEGEAINPQACNELFGLPQGTITTAAARPYLNATVCDAYKFLLTRYAPSAGGCSARYVSRTDGITKLNSDFAVRLAKMLRAAPMNINIISAYRNQNAQNCANPRVTNSNHSKGMAVDLQWDQNSCNSAACQWVIKNAPSFGVAIRMQYAPEWNHLEPNGPVTGGQGPGTGADSSVPPTGSLPLDQQIRQALGMNSAQPPLPPQPQLPSQSSGGSSGGTIPSSGTSVATPPSINTTINSTPYTPGTCNPQTYCSAIDGSIYYRATTCVDQLYQRCGNGCTGVICNATSTPQDGSSTQPQSILSNLFNTTSNGTGISLGTNTGVNGADIGTSTATAFDLIQLFANPASTTTSIGTAAPIDLRQFFQSIESIATLQPIQTTPSPTSTPAATPSSGQSPTLIISNTNTNINSVSQPQTGQTTITVNAVPSQLTAQQTFANPNSNTQTTVQSPASPILAILAQMQQVLVQAIAYLQPFGGRVQVPAWYLR